MADKEERIIEAGSKLFSKYGLRKTTVEEIAKAADVGKGTIYLYFQSKEEIFAAVIRREVAEHATRLRTAVKLEEPVVQQLRNFILTRFRSLRELVNLHNLTQEIYMEMRMELDVGSQEVVAEEKEILEGILRRGVDTGELGITDVPLVSMAIFATLRGLELPWLFEGPDMQLERKTEVLIALFIEGMKNLKGLGRSDPERQ
ncbi:MAG: TetR/AcrR family transcriptional regulator [Deltaproteobacteria bacterium]|nr:TetR/AcrR family transcriptional regulator [bacterium]MCB9475904.1 TetR/AcrR family transcriptional regulator [Deltaproteobacteria bacterium]MCB9479703.1 TetR/AcrR family transcriptional regulator [Deltaproteobacteria bacterium]MCB9488034.1 TetR/AcrR family transcriptional regulator [Deltaproteobacteria bacterium]